MFITPENTAIRAVACHVGIPSRDLRATLRKERSTLHIKIYLITTTLDNRQWLVEVEIHGSDYDARIIQGC